MENMKWNKLIVRPLDDEEKEYYKDSRINFMWEGNASEIGEEVLVWTSKYKGVYTDIWTEFDEGMGFENIDESKEPIIYWMSFPEPPKLRSNK